MKPTQQFAVETTLMLGLAGDITDKFILLIYFLTRSFFKNNCNLSIYSFPADCEHLIRRMLVLDPSKRLSVAQIKEHKWMALDVPAQRPILYQQPLSAEGETSVGEYSEQVLRLMHSLGIDQHKTIEVSFNCKTWL